MNKITANLSVSEVESILREHINKEFPNFKIKSLNFKSTKVYEDRPAGGSWEIFNGVDIILEKT